MQATFWALVPPIIAILLALLTKEVYVSLFIGIISGALFFTSFNVAGAVETTFSVMGERVGSNINIVIFLVLLGMLVALLQKSGASRAYGNWAGKAIKSKRGALAATSGLGALIFVDDYFNCLTVGTVMRPVADRHKITRAKLAYIIDATAAPICIIAPISSWAAAVSSSLPEGSAIDGFNLFLRTIPYNLYALLTIGMIIYIIALNFDFGAMKRYEQAHPDGGAQDDNEEEIGLGKKGKVKDLIVPIVVLIFLCIMSMLYTGGLFEGASVLDAFANCDAATSLVYGSFITIVFSFFWYVPRKIITFKEFTESLVDGFKAMVPAILILTLAWTLSGICSADYLDAGGYVRTLVGGSTMGMSLMPAVFFLTALGLAFATGTSWGTFGILVPIVIAVFGDVASELMVITVSAVLAGAVCGDHVSPISDTTILSSAGAKCNHIEHVSTQMPYALIVAACCLVGYILSGVLANGYIGLGAGAVLLFVTLTVVYRMTKKKQAA
nr:Na+/H+ antiporter NhaC family protein [Maliibacterium massiliense]